MQLAVELAAQLVGQLAVQLAMQLTMQLAVQLAGGLLEVRLGGLTVELVLHELLSSWLFFFPPAHVI